MKLKDMKLQPRIESRAIQINDNIKLEVQQYLPMSRKSNMLSFIIMTALDEKTGRFSPIRIEVSFALALCRWYGGIEFSEEDMKDVENTYDILETNGVVKAIISAIPDEEYELIADLVNETTKDIADYNSSAAGILNIMNQDAGNLSEQLDDILNRIKNREGLELLEEIKNVGGNE